MRDSRALNSSTISLLSRVLCTYKVIRGIKAADCAKRRSLNVKESHDNQYDCLGSLLVDASWCSSRNQAVDPSINNSVVRVFIRPRFFQASFARLVDEFHRRNTDELAPPNSCRKLVSRPHFLSSNHPPYLFLVSLSVSPSLLSSPPFFILRYRSVSLSRAVPLSLFLTLSLSLRVLPCFFGYTTVAAR